MREKTHNKILYANKWTYYSAWGTARTCVHRYIRLSSEGHYSRARLLREVRRVIVEMARELHDGAVRVGIEKVYRERARESG